MSISTAFGSTSLDELDDELGELICLAYQWGLVGAK